MALTRQTVIPALNLVTALARNQAKSMMPLNYQWFKRESLEPNHATGQILEALVKVTSQWLQETGKSKHTASLETANGQYLDAIGAGYGIARLFGELDDNYALRIQQELLIERITKPAILAGLQQLVPYAELFEPWRKLPIPSDNWILSGDTPLGSADFWNAAVFEARLYGSSGYIPGLDNFFQVMKAYGVKYWIAVLFPDQFIDYNDDPLSPLVAVPTVPTYPTGFVQDPRSVSRPNSVIGSTLELVTDIIPGTQEINSIPGEAAIPSWTFVPSGNWADDLWFTIERVYDYYTPSTSALYAMDVLPIAILDPDSPNYNTIVTNNYEVASYDPADLLNNIIISEDVDASAAAGYSILSTYRPEFTVDTMESDVQGACVIEQLP